MNLELSKRKMKYEEIIRKESLAHLQKKRNIIYA